MEILSSSILYLYALAPVAVSIGYFPIVREVYKKKKAQSLSAWGLWVATATVGTLYSFIHLDDIFVRISMTSQLILIYLIFFGSLQLQK